MGAEQLVEEIYLAGGCLWGVQAFTATLPGVILTEAGRANGTSQRLDGPYDGYAECVRTQFDPAVVSVEQLMAYLFEIIDPYSVNRQGPDVGQKSTPPNRVTSKLLVLSLLPEMTPTASPSRCGL